eukprot:CAMPEP_0168471496 /NCGR_PEP_ID=MMETSP0228-20121227/59313_1 /TAXON_ID=133427 /ORGANISM="Protoceratium reticulatum, Strain CCCM 535 (=CCMP 1889)" /LENGTH=39 /DNA_ID= /DNA_START= /DNA_END= /DNA_ORIENTATION=
MRTSRSTTTALGLSGEGGAGPPPSSTVPGPAGPGAFCVD